MFDDIKHLFSILRDPDRFGEFWVFLSLILGGLLGRMLISNRKNEMESLKKELIEKIQDDRDFNNLEIAGIRQKQFSDAAKVATYLEDCRIKAKAIDDLNMNVVTLTTQFTGISNFQNLVAENSKNELLRLDVRVNGIESILKEGNKETMSAISKVSENVHEMAKTVARIDERTKRGDE